MQILKDTTLLASLEEETAMENYNREEAKLLATLFPSVASQLRGMLSGLYLSATALAPAEAREKDAELDRRAARLDQSYYQILRLVNNLTFAANLDSQRVMQMQNCDLVSLGEEFCHQSEALAHLLKLDLRFKSSHQQIICAVNPEAIHQALFQLLSNAFKFTQAGGTVTVSIKRCSEQILLSVADTGCGMDDLQLKILFDRFCHKEIVEPVPHGFGLGLSLCRRIAEDHGGSLVAESRLDVGSKFTLCLPATISKNASLSDVPFDYAGGFNRSLLGLADALPIDAFLIRNR